MTSASDHEVRQPSQQNTVESHLLPSASLDPDSTTTGKRKGSIPNASPTPIPTSPRKRDDIHFQQTERRTTEVTQTRQSISITRHGACPLDTDSGARTEVCNWQGTVRAKLVKEGYQTLAVMCTFVAGVQGQLLQLTYGQTDGKSQIINALFFAGLFADIGAAILSASSARWFEMLTPQEADHVYDSSVVGSEEDGRGKTSSKGWREGKGSSSAIYAAAMESMELEAQVPTAKHKSHFWVERWLNLGLKSGPYAGFTGLGFLAVGMMLYVWVHTPMIVQILSTISCICLILLLPPFFLSHDRVQTLRYVRLHRHSGPSSCA